MRRFVGSLALLVTCYLGLPGCGGGSGGINTGEAEITITGRLVDATGSPIARAVITVFDLAEPIAAAETADDGRFAFGRLMISEEQLEEGLELEVAAAGFTERIVASIDGAVRQLDLLITVFEDRIEATVMSGSSSSTSDELESQTVSQGASDEPGASSPSSSSGSSGSSSGNASSSSSSGGTGTESSSGTPSGPTMPPAGTTPEPMPPATNETDPEEGEPPRVTTSSSSSSTGGPLGVGIPHHDGSLTAPPQSSSSSSSSSGGEIPHEGPPLTPDDLGVHEANNDPGQGSSMETEEEPNEPDVVPSDGDDVREENSIDDAGLDGGTGDFDPANDAPAEALPEPAPPREDEGGGLQTGGLPGGR